MHIYLLGRLLVANGDETIDRFPTRRAEMLLAFLALNRQEHPRILLAEMLWPGANPDAIRLRLNQTVAEIRRTLRPFGEAILSDRFSVQLHPSVTTEVGAFYDALKVAYEEQEPPKRSALLAAATQMVQHELLPGFFADWVETAGDQLSERLKGALAEQTDLAIQEERWIDAIQPASRLAIMEAYSETNQQKFLTVLIKAGRPERALASYRMFQNLLRNDLGLTPTEETTAIVRDLLSQACSVNISPVLLPRPAASVQADRGSIEDVLETYIASNDAERALRTVTALLQYWNLRGEMRRAYDWHRRALAMPGARMAPTDARCYALITFAATLVSAGDFRSMSAARAALTRALGLARNLRSQKLVAEAWRGMGHCALRSGEVEAAQDAFVKSLNLATEYDDIGSIADSWIGLGEAHRFARRYMEAEEAHLKARDLRAKMGRKDRVAHSLLNLGIVYSREARYGEALETIRDALRVLRAVGSRAVVADCLMEIAGALAFSGGPEGAARLLSAVSHLREAISAPIPFADRPDYVRFLSATREQLSREAFGAEWDLGRAASLDEIIDLALAD